MLKLFGGGGGNGDGKTRWQGKSFRIEQYHVTVEDVLAEGGFALVFQVKGGRGQKHALKRMAVNNDQDLHIARQEVAITKALSDCPHSVTYLASTIIQTAPDVHEVLILLELYTGGRVVDMMNARLKTGLSEDEVMKIFTDVCQAVARLHHRTKPIIHRDLKIENILRDSHGNYVLCDYGSCTVKMMHPEVLGAALCEEQIAKFTTLPYRAPEMVSLYSGHTITTKADIWALGCLLYKLCFFTTPFGEQPLAIVSGTFQIPDNSKYSDPLHSLIRYMLEPDIDKRPTIWQVAEVAFRILKLKNSIKNVFHSHAPPSSLPAAPRSSSNKTPPSNQSTSKTAATKSTTPKEKTHTSGTPHHPSVTPTASTPVVSNSKHLKTPTSAVVRGRPRARPAHRAPSPNFTTTASHIPSHLHPPSTPGSIATSLDSGLNKFGVSGEAHVTRDLEQEQQHLRRQQQQRARSSDHHKCKSVYIELDDNSGALDEFGQPYFTPQKQVVHRSREQTRDEFGHTPFMTSQERTADGASHVHTYDGVDDFGAPRFTSRATSQQSSTSTSSQTVQDVFGSRPFVQSTDAFGATPFVTS